MIASEVVTNALRVEVDRKGEKVLCAMVKVSRKQTPEEVVRKTINALNNAASFKQHGKCIFCGRETMVQKVDKSEIAGSSFLAYHILRGSPQKNPYVCYSCSVAWTFLKSLGANNKGTLRFIVFTSEGVLYFPDRTEGWKKLFSGKIKLTSPYVVLYTPKPQNCITSMAVGMDSDYVPVNTSSDYPGQFVIVNRPCWEEHIRKGSKEKEVVEDVRLSVPEKLLLCGIYKRLLKKQRD